MALILGTRLGSYEILAALGAGGMGEVYRARDTRLDRDVAIKILPDAFVSDPDRVARFQREAKVLASLNHPNIAIIHGLEHADGTHALVMELVDGEDLSARIARGPVPIDEALPIAKRIAEALEAAHEQGIIHRDLKPANIKVRPDGTVKVLDFGLAKAMEPAGGSSPSMSKSPTITTPAMMTGVGVILGTAAYMSPEQARGRIADKRADIWAFGAVLYEMLAGQRAFKGEEISDVLAAVLRQDIDWTALPVGTPVRLRRLLTRCLDRDLKRRLRDIGEARVQLEDLIGGRPDETIITPPDLRPRRRIAIASAGLFVGAALTALTLGAFVSTRHPLEAPSPPVTRLLMGLEPAESILGGPGTIAQNRPTRTAMAWSPDGRTLVFGGVRAGVEQLYVRRLDQLQATPLAGTEGAVSPFVSPDGRWVGFWAAGELKKVSTGGGPAVTVCKAPLIAGATWADGDVIYFDSGGSTQTGLGISRVAAGGGRPEPVAMPDTSKGEFAYRLPHALPGGKVLLFTMATGPMNAGAQTVARSLATGRQIVVTEGADARYVPTGHLAFVRQGTLLAAPFDATELRLTGDAVGVVEDVMQAFNAPTATLLTGAAQFDVSSTGSLAYALGGGFSEDLRSLVWVDRTGAVTPLPLPPRAYWNPRLALGGQRLAFFTGGPGGRVWISDLRNGISTPVTERGSAGFPVWTPDGARIAFSDATNLFWQRADGGGGPERLTTGPNSQAPNSWSPDGQMLAFVESKSAYESHIWLLPVGEGKAPARPWLNTRFSETHPDWSPDGRWLAYASNESGRSEVYIQPYPGPGPRYAVSRDGGTSPVWAPNGRELFYLVPALGNPQYDRAMGSGGFNLRDDQSTTGAERSSGGFGQVMMMTVPVTTAPAFSTGTPRKLFEGRFVVSVPSRSYDVMADGRRFIMVQPGEEAPQSVTQIVVVQNWAEELKRLIPTK